ncbi:aminotransferase class V-fold PLP-dependent enzyme [Helicobacter burdigaliensis]|uniref:aminotransferase class V-fold PLP-dependent enzyme n=1 Tax=Helicobacter burdigaliensis TaxID=2315334 RepID=UPI000EF66894|nr:aminotransferase class V-fold PLP-dependent enzyme [Helicobacter burdigaliensis]
MEDKRLIYLDNAATSFPKAPGVKEAISNFLENIGASPSRSAHPLSIASGRILHSSRSLLAKMLGLKDLKRILFTLNATSAINMALKGILKEKDIVVTTQMEHNAIKRPLNALKDKLNLQIREIPTDSLGNLDLKKAQNLCKGARVLACVHVNNVMGAILPLEELSQIAKSTNTLFLLDATQSAGIIALNDIFTKVDLLALSAHKGLLAPMGVGVLALSDSFNQDCLEPLVYGGTGSLSEEEFQPNFLPDKFESGTPNMHGIAGLKAALEWIEQKGVANIYQEKYELGLYLKEKLSSLNNIQTYFPSFGIANFSFRLKNKSISEVGLKLGETYGICLRVGLHCSPATHKVLGSLKWGGTLRVGLGAFNTKEEMDYLLFALKEISKS